MAISLSSPVTGSAQTGFTAPTYTLVPDVPQKGSAKTWAVSAIGGTQAGVTAHTIARPFTVSWFQSAGTPLPVPNVNGVVVSVPRNNHQLIVRAGVLPLAGQANQIALCRIRFEIPAGSDTADAAQLRAMLSLAIGALSQISAGIGDTVVSNIV